MWTYVNPKALLVLSLLSVITVHAAWEKVSENSRSINYIDKTTIRKDGDLRKVWRLSDLKQREMTGEMSVRIRVEHDCKEDRFRYLYISNHSEAMAGGEIIHQGNKEDKDWSEVPPETLSAAVHKIVCAK